MIRGGCAVLAIALVAGAPSLRSAQREGGAEARFEFAQPHMGTLVRITLYARGEAEAARASSAAFARVARLDAALSDYRDDSELSALSRRSGTGPVAVSEDLLRVLAAAQAMARASGGAFDVTCGPLSVLWRQARRRGTLPDPERLAAARASVGYARLALDGTARSAVLRDAGMQLDLGGIAKGFAADEALKTLEFTGIRRALVAAGGDVVAGAAPPGERGWRVAIGTIEGAPARPALTLAHAGASTSGDAEQFVIVGGARYSHIFDPRTGMALTGRRSVTIVARDATTSDALATAVSVMGPVDGLALVDRTRGAAGIVAEDDGNGVREYESSRWRDRAR